MDNWMWTKGINDYDAVDRESVWISEAKKKMDVEGDIEKKKKKEEAPKGSSHETYEDNVSKKTFKKI